MKTFLFSFLIALFSFLVTPVFADSAIFISSDASWKASQKFTVSWESESFNDTQWQFAVAPSIGTCTLGRQKPAFTTPMWILSAHEFQTVYFRKKFEVIGIAKKATLTFAFDDDGEVYLNGKKIFIDSSGRTESQAITMDVSSFITPGINTLALKVIDTKGGCQWAQVYAELVVQTEPAQEEKLFMQTDDRWKDEIYAGGIKDKLDCGSTLGSCGCAVTSLAMLLDAYGVKKDHWGNEIHPGTLNNYFLQNQTCSTEGCISLGYVFGAVRWSAAHGLTKKAYDIYSSPKIQFFGYKAFDKTSILESLHTQNRPIIGKDPLKSHWFLLSSEMENDIQILDPVYGKTSLNIQYQGKAEPTLDFQEVHSDFSAIEIYAKDGATVSIWRPDGKEISKNTITKEIVDYPESLGTHTLTRYVLIHPQTGAYTISTDFPNKVALYISDQHAGELFRQLASKETGVDYEPEDISKSSTHDIFPQAQACSSETTQLQFPIIFTLRKDRDYVYRGELIATELLRVVP